MSEGNAESQPWRCLYCRMRTGVRLFGVPVCGICRDQVQDFIWVSSIQGLLVIGGLINGLQFAVEEILLFGILVLVKHRFSHVFDRFVRRV